MPLVLPIFLCTLHVCLSIAKSINVTVDDRYGAWPAYGISQSISYGEGWFDSGLSKCNGCQFLPGMTGFGAALNQTWKRATYERDKPQDEPKIATFTFNGSAVYVNIIRAPTTAGGVRGNMELLFILDGVASRIEGDAKPTVFAQTPFSQSALPQGEHTLTIQNGDPNGEGLALAFKRSGFKLQASSFSFRPQGPGTEADEEWLCYHSCNPGADSLYCAHYFDLRRTLTSNVLQPCPHARYVKVATIANEMVVLRRITIASLIASDL
ncbi:hypothetical protein ONZ45_g2833 [Pleurotus djamor]|nr:hypothetical protein ONZ45_g2833 [Pleurotus djamor]